MTRAFLSMVVVAALGAASCGGPDAITSSPSVPTTDLSTSTTDLVSTSVADSPSGPLDAAFDRSGVVIVDSFSNTNGGSCRDGAAIAMGFRPTRDSAANVGVMARPPVHIAMLRERMVGRYRWIPEAEFEDAIATTNLLPGPASTERIHRPAGCGGRA